MVEFNRSIAIVVGINQYQNGVKPLRTAVSDATEISQVLKVDHGYHVSLLTDQQATLAMLRSLLANVLPKTVQPDDKLLFYFAGHGIAFNSDEGPEGYLIPQDAVLGESYTYLPMTEVHDALTQLSCRHFLGIFDCCFAGAFRWSATRDVLVPPKVIHKERYERFITDPAWQVITSAADDQHALDALALSNQRGHQVGQHSPFAQAFIQALQANSDADASPPASHGQPAGDGIITATELYQYLRDTIEPETTAKVRRQTPGLWPLKNHGKGEFIFHVPGRSLSLPEAPPLNEASNPYRGLESFEESHQHLFFGRQALTQELKDFVESHPKTVVLGASSSGKSSLVKAGLVPSLRRELNTEAQSLWQVLAIFRPGKMPLNALSQALNISLTVDSEEDRISVLSDRLDHCQKANSNTKFLLIIDQAEELFSLCTDAKERQNFIQLLAQSQESRINWFHIIFILRSDFEAQFYSSSIEKFCQFDRFLIRSMNRDELRSVIEEPASAKVIYFDPPELVEKLIDTVYETPGTLPLLSLTLNKLFLSFLHNASVRTNRAITIDDYESVGEVKKILINLAERSCHLLIAQDAEFLYIIRRVMLRMISIEDNEIIPRKIFESELIYSNREENRKVQILIDAFINSALIVKGKMDSNEAYIEFSHHLLPRRWQRILDWIYKSKFLDLLNLQDHVRTLTRDWIKQKRRHDLLLSAGKRLDECQSLLKNPINILNAYEVNFIEESVYFCKIDKRRKSAERKAKKITDMLHENPNYALALAIDEVGKDLEILPEKVSFPIRKVLIESTKQARVLKTIEFSKEPITAMLISPVDESIILGHSDGEIEWLNMNGDVIKSLNYKSKKAINAIAMHPYQDLI